MTCSLRATRSVMSRLTADHLSVGFRQRNSALFHRTDAACPGLCCDSRQREMFARGCVRWMPSPCDWRSSHSHADTDPSSTQPDSAHTEDAAQRSVRNVIPRRQGVDVWCADDVVAVTTDTAGAQLIGEDEDDVGLTCHAPYPISTIRCPAST